MSNPRYPRERPGAGAADHDLNADELGGSTWRLLEHRVPEVVRKALVTGLGAVFLTEEGVRHAVGDLKLPKEAVSYIAAQADKSKREVMNVLAREVRAFLERVDLSGVLSRVLAGSTLEVHAQIRLKPKADRVEPSIEVLHLGAANEPAPSQPPPTTAGVAQGRSSRSAGAARARGRKEKK